MILWFYSNKCILVFFHLLTQGSWNPFNFLRGASFVLMRWLWVGSWITPGWGLLTRKPDLGLEAWGFQPHLHPPGSGRGWRLGECHAHLRKPPQQSQQQGMGELPCCGHFHMLGGGHQLHGDRAAVLGPSQTSPWGHCFTWTLICVLYHIL